MTDPGQVRKFRHIRKGLVEGRIVREDETWAQIELARETTDSPTGPNATAAASMKQARS